MKEKLEQVDEILASFEDWMHGKDGNNCTKARRILSELMNEVKLFVPVINTDCETGHIQRDAQGFLSTPDIDKRI